MKTVKGIWIPPDEREEDAKFGCHLCLRTWPERQRREWEAHFRQCISEHRDEIHELSKPMIPVLDPEIAVHMEKVGDRMIRERRLEMRPNERASG